MVSVLDFFFDDPSLNPAEVYNNIVENLLEKNKKGAVNGSLKYWLLESISYISTHKRLIQVCRYHKPTCSIL